MCIILISRSSTSFPVPVYVPSMEHCSFFFLFVSFFYSERSGIYILKQVHVKCGCKLFEH